MKFGSKNEHSFKWSDPWGEKLSALFHICSFCETVEQYFSKMSHSTSDIWKPGTPFPTLPKQIGSDRLLVSSNSIVVFGDKTTDFYEFHPFNRNIYRTARSELNLYDTLFDLIPDTSQFVLAKGHEKDILVIHDLKNDITICEMTVDMRISDVKCGRNEFPTSNAAEMH